MVLDKRVQHLHIFTSNKSQRLTEQKKNTHTLLQNHFSITHITNVRLNHILTVWKTIALTKKMSDKRSESKRTGSNRRHRSSENLMGSRFYEHLYKCKIIMKILEEKTKSNLYRHKISQWQTYFFPVCRRSDLSASLSNFPSMPSESNLYPSN